MKEIITIANYEEKAKVGYVSTYVKMNRDTNEILSVGYYWCEKLDSVKSKAFDSFESLNTFINKLVDTKNESELNSFELQSNEG